MRDREDEFSEIKREIIESRALVIKATNQTSALAADIRAIAKKQDAQERKVVFNSAVAYIAFVVALLLIVKFAWDARVDSVKSDSERKSLDNVRLAKEAEVVRKRDDDRARAEVRAEQFYALIRQGKRAEIVEGFENVRKEPLSRAELATFTDAYERARTELSVVQYEQAREKLKIERFQEAASLLEQALKLKNDGANAPTIKLTLGQTYRKLKRQKDAILVLMEITDKTADHEVEDDALYQLAYCQMETEAWNDAKNTWRDLIKRFPESHFAGEAKMQLATLNLLH